MQDINELREKLYKIEEEVRSLGVSLWHRRTKRRGWKKRKKEDRGKKNKTNKMKIENRKNYVTWPYYLFA